MLARVHPDGMVGTREELAAIVQDLGEADAELVLSFSPAPD
jgi:hypothetical protein